MNKQVIFSLHLALVLTEGWVDLALKDIAARYVKKAAVPKHKYENILQTLVTRTRRRNKADKNLDTSNAENETLEKDMIFDKLNKFSHQAFGKNEERVRPSQPKPGFHQNKLFKNNNEINLSNSAPEEENNKINLHHEKHKGKAKPPESDSKNKLKTKMDIKKKKARKAQSGHKNKTEKNNVPRFRREAVAKKSAEHRAKVVDRTKRSSVKRVLKEEFVDAVTLPKTLERVELTTTKQPDPPDYSRYCFTRIIDIHHDIFEQYGKFRFSKLEERSNISESLLNLLSDFWKEYSAISSRNCATIHFKEDEFKVDTENSTLILPSFPNFDLSYIHTTERASLPVIKTTEIPKTNTYYQASNTQQELPQPNQYPMMDRYTPASPQEMPQNSLAVVESLNLNPKEANPGYPQYYQTQVGVPISENSSQLTSFSPSAQSAYPEQAHSLLLVSENRVNLPTELPKSQESGHIPFSFTLSSNLEPNETAPYQASMNYNQYYQGVQPDSQTGTQDISGNVQASRTSQTDQLNEKRYPESGPEQPRTTFFPQKYQALNSQPFPYESQKQPTNAIQQVLPVKRLERENQDNSSLTLKRIRNAIDRFKLKARKNPIVHLDE